MIPLVRPTIEQDDIDAIAVAAKRKTMQQGVICRRFERAFGNYLDLPQGMVTSSGTTALYLALKGLGVCKGDEVIIPTYTCVALLNAVTYVGATPILADCNFDVANMDSNLSVDSVADRVNRNTKAIIVPHMFGRVAKLASLRCLTVPIIEDGTMAIGAEYGLRRIGYSGEVSIFSFHESKMLSCGEGGMVLSRSDDTMKGIRHLNNWQDEQPSLRTKDCTRIAFTERYNYRMSDLSAALGLSQLRKMDKFINKRIAIAKKYDTVFQHIAGIELPSVKCGRRNVFFRYMIRLEDRDVVSILRQFKTAGIEVGRGVYPPLHYYLHEKSSKYPNAERAVGSLLSIPLYPSLTESEIDHIIKTTKVILG